MVSGSWEPEHSTTEWIGDIYSSTLHPLIKPNIHEILISATKNTILYKLVALKPQNMIFSRNNSINTCFEAVLDRLLYHRLGIHIPRYILGTDPDFSIIGYC